MNDSLSEIQGNIFPLHPLCQIGERRIGDLIGQIDAALHARTAQAAVFGDNRDELNAGLVDYVVDVEQPSAADIAPHGPVDHQPAALNPLLFQLLRRAAGRTHTDKIGRCHHDGALCRGRGKQQPGADSGRRVKQDAVIVRLQLRNQLAHQLRRDALIGRRAGQERYALLLQAVSLLSK